MNNNPVFDPGRESIGEKRREMCNLILPGDLSEREAAIRVIAALYPADSEFEDTAQIGQKLLTQTIDEIEGAAAWREKSTAVLVRYAQLSLDEWRLKRPPS